MNIMKTLRFVGAILLTAIMGMNLISCNKDDNTNNESVDEDYKVDLSGLIKTNLQIDNKTFWLEDDYNSIVINDWDENESMSVFFRGKTEELECADIYAEDIPIKEYFNKNKTIGKFTYIRVAERFYDNDYEYFNWVNYEFLNGRVSIREDAGVLTLNFNNALFKDGSTGKCRNLNGYISYRI